MPAITILCHGTSNSTNRSTSGGSELVISKIASLLAGVDGQNWILNEGAGTKELNKQRGLTGYVEKKVAGLMGVAAGDGVQVNVDKSMAFVKAAANALGGLPVVNLAGHSRGSITCYKIASALYDWNPLVQVNIFAIDPVPGNNGRINKEMHEHIAVRSNVQSSYLMLAESEHRQNFRPYIDGIYTDSTVKGHKFDTIPGTHGGINELTGQESEAAALVLNRALKFLIKRGSLFNAEVARFLFDDFGALRMYSKLMMRIKEYKARASVNPFRSGNDLGSRLNTLTTGIGNLGLSSFNVDKHRTANVAGAKQTWGTQGHVAPNPATSGRSDHHGKGMSAALTQMGVADPHAQRTNRFFANKEHEKLFGQLHRLYINEVLALEKSGDGKNVQALLRAIIGAPSQYITLEPATRTYFDAFCQARGVLP